MNDIDILVISPSTRGGSWRSIYLFINGFRKLVKGKTVICTSAYLGSIYKTGFKIFQLGFDIINNFDRILGFSPLSSLLIYLPIYLYSFILIILNRFDVIVLNGLGFLPVAIVAKIVNPKCYVVLHYHGYTKGILPRFPKFLLKKVAQYVIDLAIANSNGSKGVLSEFFDPSRILVQNHIADDIFFKHTLRRDEIRRSLNLEDKFVVSFIGHLRAEKLFDIFLKTVINIIKKTKEIVFFIVGDGDMKGYVTRLEKLSSNILYKGYIKDRKELMRIYLLSDLVWGYGDDTYLARPSIEALAVGTPLIIPNIPAVLPKRLSGKKIPRNIVPEGVGWLIDANDIEAISEFIISLKNKRTELDLMRKRCKKYAINHHSMDVLNRNIRIIVKDILDKIIH